MGSPVDGFCEMGGRWGALSERFLMGFPLFGLLCLQIAGMSLVAGEIPKAAEEKRLMREREGEEDEEEWNRREEEEANENSYRKAD